MSSNSNITNIEHLEVINFVFLRLWHLPQEINVYHRRWSVLLSETWRWQIDSTLERWKHIYWCMIYDMIYDIGYVTWYTIYDIWHETHCKNPQIWFSSQVSMNTVVSMAFTFSYVKVIWDSRWFFVCADFQFPCFFVCAYFRFSSFFHIFQNVAFLSTCF